MSRFSFHQIVRLNQDIDCTASVAAQRRMKVKARYESIELEIFLTIVGVITPVEDVIVIAGSVPPVWVGPGIVVL